MCNGGFKGMAGTCKKLFCAVFSCFGTNDGFSLQYIISCTIDDFTWGTWCGKSALDFRADFYKSSLVFPGLNQGMDFLGLSIVTAGFPCKACRDEYGILHNAGKSGYRKIRKGWINLGIKFVFFPLSKIFAQGCCAGFLVMG